MKPPEILNERTILLAVAAGDHMAFRTVFDTFRNVVFSYAMRYLKSRDLAEEVVQDVFMKIWTGRERLSAVGNFGGYLRTVTKNQTLDYLKKIASDYVLVNHKDREWSEIDLDTENGIINKDSQFYIDRMIEKLPPQQQLVYRLCKIEGLKQKDAAEKLGLSPLTIKVHLREAVKSLKTLLKDKKMIPLIAFVFMGFYK